MDPSGKPNREFWTSLNLISTQVGNDELDGALQSYATKPRDSSSRSGSLPITSIISRIQEEDSDVEDEVAKPAHPPPFYTGGKWNPTISQSLLSFEESSVGRADTPLLETGTETTDDELVGEVVGQDAKRKDLSCVICKKTFAKAENLVIHLTSNKHRCRINVDNEGVAAHLYTKHHTALMKKSAYQCMCCKFAASHHDGLIAHLKSQQHSENVAKLSGPIECVVCGFLDYDNSSLLVHCLSESHQERATSGNVLLKERRSKIKCLKCDKVLHSTLHYTRHLRSRHPKEDSNADQLKTCDYCPYTGKPADMHRHVSKTHSQEKPYLCKICQTNFHSKYDLCKHNSTMKHVNAVFESYKKPIKLTIASDADPAQTSDISQNKDVMRCHFCIFTTMELRHLQDHYMQRHEDEPIEENVRKTGDAKALFCRYCHKQLKTGTDLFNHELNHIKIHLMTQNTVDNNKDKERCFICLADFDSDGMNEHLLRHNPYKRKCYTAQAGRNSKLTASGKEGYYLCPVAGCSRTYRSQADLNIHTATHTGKLSFTCEECPKSFPTKKQLKAHLLSHSSIKPFSCDYCNYKCKTRCHLQRHTRIHAGSRPYSCPYCEYSATTVGNLRKHLLQSGKHKNLPMYECTQSRCHYVADKARKISQHLIEVHKISSNKILIKSTENDWTDIIEGHPIIPTQHS